MYYNRCIFYYNLFICILFIRFNLFYMFIRYRFILVIKVKFNYNLFRNYIGFFKNYYIYDFVLFIFLILIVINFTVE